MTKLHALIQQGQAAWFDYIKRSFLDTGELDSWVAKGIRGVTSNPAIFEKAIAGSDDYDADIQQLTAAGKSVVDIYETLVIDDIRHAADILRPVYDDSNGGDGYVSLEVSPALANDTAKTIAEAKRLFAALDRPNVMIKIPATPAGIPAIEMVIAAGVNVNVTLIFSLSHYESVAGAYLAGLEKLLAAGGDPARVASVASFFVSRVDTVVDADLKKMGNSELLGTIAVDNARLAYVRFQEIFSGARWEKLARAGARVQRPLWASTGTKNPDYSDTIYVDTLVGPDTVNTMPPATLDAFMEHGVVACTLTKDVEGAHARMARIAELGINLESVTNTLQDDGVILFAKAFDALLASISEKRARYLQSA
jgi:transaldolase